MSVELQYLATALLHLLDTTDAGGEFRRTCELGGRYRQAQGLYRSYEAAAIDWCFASNLDTSAQAIVAADEWWPEDGEPPRGALVLEGGKGTGKTTAAVRLLLRHGGLFVRAGQMHDIELGDADVLEKMRWAPLLVLDNLGSEKDIGPTLARIHAVIVHRDGARLPMVFTTTLAPYWKDPRTGAPIPKVDKMRTVTGRYEDDVADRLMTGRWERVRGESMRRQGQPDLRDALRSARRWDALQDVEAARRGNGDPRGAIVAISKACGFTVEELKKEASELSRSAAEAIAEMPEYLRVNPVMARYAETHGVA